MDSIGKYIISITAVCICCGIIRRLTDGKSGIEGIVKSLCGIVLAITVLSPAVSIRASDFEPFANHIKSEADDFVKQGIDLSMQELRTIITRETTAYILEKATLYDCSIQQMEVELSSDTIPAPNAIRICGTFAPQNRNRLSDIIEANLGVPKEKQQWIYQN